MSKYRGRSHRRERWRRVTRIMARDGAGCAICGEPLDRALRAPEDPRYITFDHKTPRSRGGLDGEPNLRLAHRACNERRGNDPLEETEEPA